MKVELIKLLEKYLPLGVVKGGELALPPQEALCLATDLQTLGVAITGLDGWYYVNDDPQKIAQDLEVDLTLDENMVHGQAGVKQSAVLIKQFITDFLPPRTRLVSFSLDVPAEWHLFPTQVSTSSESVFYKG